MKTKRTFNGLLEGFWKNAKLLRFPLPAECKEPRTIRALRSTDYNKTWIAMDSRGHYAYGKTALIAVKTLLYEPHLPDGNGDFFHR